MPVFVVTGPPCSGKSTYVREHAQPDDVVIDYDVLAQALGSSVHHGHATHFDAIVGKARWAAIKAALEASRTDGATVWIIDSCIPDYRLRHYQQAGAEIITLDVDRAELHRRASRERPELWHRLIDDWAPLLRDAGPAWRPEREYDRSPRPWKRPEHRRGAHGPRYERLRSAFLADKTNCEYCGEPFVTDAPCNHPRCVKRGKGCIFHPRYPTVDHSKALAHRATTHIDPLDTSLWRAACSACNKSRGGQLGRELQLQRAANTPGPVDLDW